MAYQTLYEKQLALCAEIDQVIILSDEAQASVSDDHQFLRKVSLLFNRIHVLEAIKDQAMLPLLEASEQAARSVGCDVE